MGRMFDKTPFGVGGAPRNPHFSLGGGGIKTIPCMYVRQKNPNPVGTFGKQPPGRHAVQRGQPSTCCSAFCPSLGTFLRGWFERWKFGQISTTSEVSVDEYEVQRKKPVF